MSKIVGAILCGGEGRQTGSHKASHIQKNGLTLVENIHQAVDMYCQETVLVGHAEGVPDSLSHLKHIPDNYSHCGPLGGLEAVLNSQLGDIYMIAPCGDLAVDPRIYELLLMHEQQAPVVIQTNDGALTPLGIYPGSLRTLTTQHIAYNDLSMEHFLKTCEAEILILADVLPEDSSKKGPSHNLRV